MKPRIKAFALNLVLAMILGGCAAPQDVVNQQAVVTAPMHGSAAKLRVTSTIAGNVFVKQWTYKDCETGKASEVAILGRNANLLFPRGTDRRVGIPLLEGLPATQVSELEIPAENVYYLEMRTPSVASIVGTAVTYDWCTRRIKFIPSSGAVYEASFEHARSAGDSPCSIVLREIKPTGSGSYARIDAPEYSPATRTCEPTK